MHITQIVLKWKQITVVYTVHGFEIANTVVMQS